MTKTNTIVVYHYFEANPLYRDNFAFFLRAGIDSDVDYLCIISGTCSLELPQLSNIRYFKTENVGLDFGAYARALRTIDPDEYAYFVFLNCTVIGPFLPSKRIRAWACTFTNILDDRIKVVGVTINILHSEGFAEMYQRTYGGSPPYPHVQTMLFAIDRICLHYLNGKGFFRSDAATKDSVVENYEIRLSQIVLQNGWNIACIMPEYQGIDYASISEDINPTSRLGDPWFPKAYFGRTIHPLESIFFKNNRGLMSEDEIKGLCRSQEAMIRVPHQNPSTEPTIKVGHILVCHSVSPDKLFASIPNIAGHCWYVFFHGEDHKLARHVERLVRERDGDFFPYMVNRGLAKSWNEGIHMAQQAGCDAFLLLNDDLFFYDEAYLEFLGTIRAVNINSDNVSFISTMGLESGASPYAGQVLAQSFACCAVMPSSIARIGYFDENFAPAYFEDVDYARRAALAGMTVHIDPRTLVEHERSSTTRQNEDLRRRGEETFARNRAYFELKWGGSGGTERFVKPFNREDTDGRILFRDKEHPYSINIT